MGIGSNGLTVDARKKVKAKTNNKRERFFPYADSGGKSTGIKEVIHLVMSLKGRPHITEYLFCTTRGKKRGKAYIQEDGRTSGFDSVWQRAMRKALKETELTASFTEHDLRAKVGSDASSDDEAKEQLDHANTAITRKVYRRKAITIPVAKGFSITRDQTY